MQKSSFLSIQNGKQIRVPGQPPTFSKEIILHKPLHYNTDYTEIARHAKRVLLEIREAVSKPVRIGFSGGTDSLFLLFSYLELVKEDKVSKDDFIITNLKFIYEKGHSPKILNTELENWLRDWYDKYIDETYVFNAGDTKAVVEYNKKYIKPVRMIPSLYNMAREALGDYMIVADADPMMNKEGLHLQGSDFHSLQTNTLEIDLFTWDVDIWCSVMDKKRMQFKVDYSDVYEKSDIVNKSTFLWHKHSRYFECYPECMLGYPKRLEQDITHVTDFLLTIPAYEKYFSKRLASCLQPCYIYNDKLEQIKTVEDSLYMIT